MVLGRFPPIISLFPRSVKLPYEGVDHSEHVFRSFLILVRAQAQQNKYYLTFTLTSVTYWIKIADQLPKLLPNQRLRTMRRKGRQKNDSDSATINLITVTRKAIHNK